MPDRSTLFAVAYEIGLLLAGLVLLWRIALRPAARRQPAPVALAGWEAPLGEFFLFLWLVISGMTLASLGASFLLRFDFFLGDAKTAIAAAVFQLGTLAGIAIFWKFFDHHRSPPVVSSTPGSFAAGAATFLIAMPVVAGVAFVWQFLMTVCGISFERQDLIRVFGEADSPVFLLVMILLACVGAPITEELIFRGGIFRYARTRLPRWAALLIPAGLFGAMHQNLASFAPLVALGIIFSLAYERTGNIKTTMIAHALFNLNSIVLVFAGVST